MSKQQKTKQGMASIYVVVFVTILIGVITLSFLRIMLSETGKTEKDTLADAAMDSAMAGVEDAKLILAKYYKCEGDSSTECENVRKIVDGTGDGCDLGSNEGESSVGFGGDDYTGDINDQAYTCVNLAVDGDFKGEISNSSPVLVIPMRVNGHNVAAVKGVEISWNGGSGLGGYGNQSGNGYNNKVNNTGIDKGILGRKGVNNDGDNTNKNALNVMLIQSGSDYDIDSFYASTADGANRGTIMLVPSNEDGQTMVNGQEFIDSADKTYNAPIAVKCKEDNDQCVVKVGFPDPANGDARIEGTFFLVISRVYTEPTVDVTVKMKKDMSSDDESSFIPFHGVQPIIDSTGRAGNLVRRVEVRLNADYSAFVPLSELTVNGDINKSFFVTRNCVSGSTECH